MRSGRNLYRMLVILSMAGYGWIGFHFLSRESDESPTTVCLFKNVTGVPCPSCGTTRAIVLLMNGEPAEAFLINPLGLLAATMLLLIPVWLITDLLFQKNTLAQSLLWTERKIKEKKAIYLPLVALVLLNWGWNILKDL